MMTPQTGGDDLCWFSNMLRQMVNWPPAACAQTPSGTTLGQGCGVGLGVDGMAFAGSRFAESRELLTAWTTTVSHGREELCQVQPPLQLAHAGTAAVCAPSRAAWLIAPYTV